jgi:hypothetical protein
VAVTPVLQAFVERIDVEASTRFSAEVYADRERGILLERMIGANEIRERMAR